MTGVRVCVIGDSITDGTEDTAFLSWPGWRCAAEVAKGHDLTEYNLGIPHLDMIALLINGPA